MPHLEPPFLFMRLAPVVTFLASASVLALGGCSPPPVVTGTATQVGAGAPVLDVERGRLLYEAHCVACHDRQVHWRDPSIVESWSDLLLQVERWQAYAGQDWTGSEVGDVAAHLNTVYYRMPCPVPGCSPASTALSAPGAGIDLPAGAGGDAPKMVPST